MPNLQEAFLRETMEEQEQKPKSFFELPIVTDPRIKNKNQALIFPDKLVCHPDLKKKLEEAMAGVKAGAPPEEGTT